MTGRTFGRTDGQFPRVFAKDSFDRLGFTDIALRGRGAVGVDVVDLFGIQPGVFQRHPHTPGGAFAFGRRGGHVIRIGRVAVADQLAIDARTARLRVFQFLEHDNRGTLAHDEAIAAEVKRP